MSLGVVAVGTAWRARWLRRRLGGYTGDALGATQQITELFALLGWLGMARWVSWASGATHGRRGSKGAASGALKCRSIAARASGSHTETAGGRGGMAPGAR